MDRVKFINIEDEELDLVLSFALVDDEILVKSLVLLRTPAYEILLPEHERGIHVSMEGDVDLENNLLLEISIGNGTVTISTLQKSYELDTSRIEKRELEEMLIFIEKLNFDSSFKVNNA